MTQPALPRVTMELRDFTALRNGAPLLDALRFTLEPGTVLGVVGPNGVGKSTLLGALAFAGVVGTGSALVNGRPLESMRARERARFISLMAQDHRAPNELRVRELVAVGAHAARGASAHAAVDAAMHRAEISHLAERRYGSLSGGQRQLVQFARVLAQHTPIVMLDEPTSALDLHHQHRVEEHLHALGQEGRIVIAAIHDLNLALNTCTRVLLLHPDGSSRLGTPADMLTPAHIFEVFAAHTVTHTTAQGRRLLARDDAPPATRAAHPPAATITTHR